MELKYYDIIKSSDLLQEIYYLSFTESDLPFNSVLLPICTSNINYIFHEGQYATIKGKKMSLKKLMISGQFSSAYEINTIKPGFSFGVSLHPTALYKITNQNINHLNNSFHSLKDINSILYDILNPLFLKLKNTPDTLAKELDNTFSLLKLNINNDVKNIDTVIKVIKEKEGMLQISDLINLVPMSKRNFEIKFKKIVGLSVGKYMKLYRFVRLMRKYESESIELNDLIYIYNYYDQSHFLKDFKTFMNMSAKEYFKKDFYFVKQYLKNY